MLTLWQMIEIIATIYNHKSEIDIINYMPIFYLF